MVEEEKREVQEAAHGERRCSGRQCINGRQTVVGEWRIGRGDIHPERVSL